MVATQKLAKDDLVSRGAAKFFGPGRTEAARGLRYGRQKPLLSSKAAGRPVMNRQSLLDNPAPAPAPLLMEIAGLPRNGLEPKVVASVASLFPPDLFHPLLAFLQRHL